MRLLLSASLLVPSLVLAQASQPPSPLSPPPPPPLRAGVPISGGPSVRPAAPPGATPPPSPPPASTAPAAAPPAPGPRGAGRSQPSMAGAAAGTAHAEGKCEPLQGRFLLAFNRAEIVDVLEQASRWTCRNFIYTDDVARGKINLLSKTPVTADEAYAAFLAALSANGIAIYPSGRYYKLVRLADAKKSPIPTVLDDGTEMAPVEQPTTKIIRLKYTDPDPLRGILANFTSPQGADIQAIPPDLLIVTDIALNVLRIERIIEAVDRPGGGDLIRVVAVRYAVARELAEKINQVFTTAPAAPGRPAPKRTILGGVASQAPGAAAAAAESLAEISISKVLADDRTNKLIVIADDKSFQRILDLVKQLDVPTSGEGTIHVVFLKNANAEDLAQTLQALAQGQSSARRGTGATPSPPGAAAPPGPRGSTSADLFSGEVKITADKPSNSLVVLASGSDFAVVQRLIEKLDRPRRQVFVEAVIMEVNLTHANQFGVSMHGLAPVTTNNGTGFIPLASETGRIDTTQALSPAGLANFVSLGGFLTGLATPTPADLQTLLPGVPNLAVLIQALQTSSDVNVLSTPHVLASDNEESEITVGQNVPFQAGYNPGFGLGGLGGLGTAATGTAATAALGGLGGLGAVSPYMTSFIAPIQRQNVDLKLKVKPQISEGDNVRLELDEQTEEIVSTDPQLGPTTAKRSVKTKIVAKDQHTIVIGGLIQDRTVQSVHKVPVLGDIPVLGWLFRDTVTTKTKTNLLLFLTPYIIRDDSDYRRILERKRKEHEEFVQQFLGNEGPTYEVPVDYARKAGPYSHMHREIQTEMARVDSERTIGPGLPPEAPPSAPAPGPDAIPPGAGGPPGKS